MEYTLLDKITIARPILFLCGPYYEKTNKSDRRVILQKMLYDTYKNKYLPLVIDDFLTEENIDDPKISIQVMEEICAAISYKTYIFLDTMSAATELGIFANSAYLNQIEVFIPKTSDIYNRKNVGYFVRDVVLKKHSDRVKCLEYRPGLMRKALATDYVVEHYKFVNDELPFNIAEEIKNDPLFQQKDTHPIQISDGVMPKTPYRICYRRKEDKLTVGISLRLLFYVTLSVIANEYKDFPKSGDKDFSQFDIDFIVEKINESIINFIAGKTGENLSWCEMESLNTALKLDEWTLVYHITKFVHVYYLYSQFHRFNLLEKPLGSILDKIEVGVHPHEIFGISEEELALAEEIRGDKDKYFERIVVRKNRKSREIIKYCDDENGKRARELHEHMLRALEKAYTPADCSYAYCRGKSIKQCAARHLSSTDFMKYDIKKFFNSITPENLAERFAEAMNIDDRFMEQLSRLLDTCFYDGMLPLGLILSPILSDIYMNAFDRKVVDKLQEKGFVYTRYADDLLISRKRKMGERQKQKIDAFLERELRRLSLTLNGRKMQKIYFEHPGNYMRYVGVNIVCGSKGNFLTVGRTYIYDVAGEVLDYLWTKELQENVNRTEEEQKKLAQKLIYERKALMGKLMFVHHIEGKEGIAKVDARLRAHNVSVSELTGNEEKLWIKNYLD